MPHKLHPINSLGNVVADRGDIRVERLELRLNPRVPFPHKHDFYQIVVITSGGGQHAVDFKTYKITPAQIFILKPGQVHGWNLSLKTKGFLIEFTIESLTSSGLVQSADFIQRVHSLPDEIKIAKADFKRMLSTFERMNQETLLPREDSELYQQSQLSLCMVELLRWSSKKGRTSGLHAETTLQFQNLVEAHYKTEYGLDYYAKNLKLSSKAFADRIRKGLGVPPKDVIQNRRILEAKRLLAFSEMSIAEVGYHLGFTDPNYFSRLFRQVTKISPQGFRERARVR